MRIHRNCFNMCTNTLPYNYIISLSYLVFCMCNYISYASSVNVTISTKAALKGTWLLASDLDWITFKTCETPLLSSSQTTL